MVIVVPSITCETVPNSLARICEYALEGSAQNVADTRTNSFNRSMCSSAPLRVYGSTYLIERLAFFVKSHDKFTVSLANDALASHAISFVA
jgi:hypothetical protein